MTSKFRKKNTTESILFACKIPLKISAWYITF